MSNQTAAGNAHPKRHILQWHITHRCNLSCIHCYQKDDVCCASYESLMDVLDKYERFLEANHLYGYIYLTGGEPLTHHDFFPLLKELRRRKFCFCILTNGTLIDRHAANQIRWYQTEFVQISLDGTREIHDRIRGRGAFDQALSGIDILTEQGVPVLVSFTAQKSNLECFSELARICDQHHVRKLWWDRVVTDSPGSTAVLSLSTEEFRSFVKQAQHLSRKYRRKDGSSLVSCERSLQFLGSRDPSVCYGCHAGKDMVTILADGSVMPCRRLPFVVGNIYENELADILSENELVSQLQDPPIPEDCRSCPHVQVCRGGAKCVTYGQTGSLFAKDVNCFLNNG